MLKKGGKLTKKSAKLLAGVLDAVGPSNLKRNASLFLDEYLMLANKARLPGQHGRILAMELYRRHGNFSSWSPELREQAKYLVVHLPKKARGKPTKKIVFVMAKLLAKKKNKKASERELLDILVRLFSSNLSSFL